MNPYEVLGVARNASDEEIKNKYRTLARVHHPDKGGDKDLFIRIKDAYYVLIDPYKRQTFDESGYTFPEQLLQNEVKEMFKRMLTVILDNAKDSPLNLVLALKTETNKATEQCKKELENVKTSLKKFRTVNRRLKLKREDGDNILFLLLLERIRILEENRQNAYRRTVVCSMMDKILNDYKYGDENVDNLLTMVAGEGIAPPSSGL